MQHLISDVTTRAAERERLFEPVQALNQVAAHRPEPPERAPQAQRPLGLAMLDEPARRRPQVLGLALQALRPLALARPAQFWPGTLGQRQDPGRVLAARSVRLVRFDEAFERVLLEHFQ